MSKTFTCKELGGICEEKFSGDTFVEIMQKGAQHMMSDEAHTRAMMDMEKGTGENKEQWMARMQQEFDAKPEDNLT
jgi:hypothetical protein